MRILPRLRSAVLLCLLLPLLVCGALPVCAQFVHASGTEIVDGSGKPLKLRGINLGNWMVPEGYMWHFEGGPQSPREIEGLVTELIGPERAAAFWTSYRRDYYAQDDIRQIKRMGFNSVRIPIHWKYFQTDDAEGFQLLDRVIGWCHQEGILVVIDMHAAPGGQTGTNIDDSDGWPWLYSDAGAQQRFTETWKRIAHHYRKDTAVMGYDLLNEPVPHFPVMRQFDAKLEPLYKRATEAIRTEDKVHAIILGGARWDTDFTVFGPPFDRNLIYQLHTYWTPPVQATIQKYVDFREKNRVPVWLGESGENKDEWVAEFARLLEKNDIGWCFWPYKKMDFTSSPVTFPQPAGWDGIVAFAKLDRSIGKVEDRDKLRPSQDVIDKAFADLLVKIQFAQETRNPGYLKALFPETTMQ